ncbi:MAG: hypothetical protein ACSHW1_09870 [Yoonia sp.]
MRILLLISAFVIAACAQADRYPISGEECGPNDPVLTLDAADCTIPAMG